MQNTVGTWLISQAKLGGPFDIIYGVFWDAIKMSLKSSSVSLGMYG